MCPPFSTLNESTMQSFIATTATTTHRHPRCPDAPSHNRNRNHGLAPTRVSTPPNIFQHLAKPVQSASSRDFHLDTFFSPVWMSGPHVFSFAKEGTVVRPETYRPEPYAGYGSSAASPSSPSSSSSSPSLPSTPISRASRRLDKDWKNIAISEQDDAEFAAREAEAEVEAKGKLVGLVHTWPPKPLPAPCVRCEALAVPRRRAAAPLSIGTGTQESALSHGSSTELESGVVPGRRDVVYRKGVPLEKSVGFGRSQRKTPGALLFTEMEEGESENGWTLFGMPRETGQHDGDGVLSPLMAMPWAEDELTVSIKAMLGMHEI